MKYIIAILLGLIVSITIAFTIIHHPILDRFNPFLKTEYSYAKVHYKLTFNGFSPSRTYVEIKHKGQYVISITYVEKDDTPKEVRQE
ncbi:YxeA family protein [Staphylococcus aureus]|uniref:YxeA family protein n=1 Tax=Staphylococcus aureus TaxID=1280 RepID=UPI000851BBAB|nr:YxeA family protein [Staphylococcus aureus]